MHLQQHQFNALCEVVPGVAREEVQSRGPAGADLKAYTRCRYTSSRNLGRPETQKGVVYKNLDMCFVKTLTLLQSLKSQKM